MNPMQQLLIHVPTRKLIHLPTRRNDVHVTDLDILTHIWAAANHIPTNRIENFTRRPLEIMHGNIADRQVRGIFLAQRQIGLPVALGDFNRIVDVGDNIVAVGDVMHSTSSSTSLEVSGEFGRGAWPDFDASAVGGVGHGYGVDLYSLSAL